MSLEIEKAVVLAGYSRVLVVCVHTLSADKLGASVIGELADESGDYLPEALQGCTHVVFHQGQAKKFKVGGGVYWSVPLQVIEFGLVVPEPEGKLKKNKGKGKNKA